jgi:lipooligosaccharide transport system permease protein
MAALLPATRTFGESWRAVWQRVEAHWVWYRRSWTASIYSSGLQPLLFLTAMGIGFGSQVRQGTFGEGVTYLQFIAPALLVSSVAAIAVTDAGHPVLSGFQWKKDYVAVSATPITPGEMFSAHLIWIALRATIAATVYAVVAALLGAWTGPGVLVAVLVTVLVGTACAAPVMAIAATLRGGGYSLVALNRFAVLPMTLFAGTFFPVDRLPDLAMPLVWISPFWHGNVIARDGALGRLTLWPTVGHLAFLLALGVFGILMARSRYYRRLVV